MKIENKVVCVFKAEEAAELMQDKNQQSCTWAFDCIRVNKRPGKKNANLTAVDKSGLK